MDEAPKKEEAEKKDNDLILSVISKEIEDYEKASKDWKETNGKVEKVYNDRLEGQDVRKSKKLNLFWSNVQTLLPALFSNLPKVNIARRNKDKDPIALAVAQIVEQAMTFFTDEGGLKSAVSLAVQDYLIASRGQVWVRFDAEVDDNDNIRKEGIYFDFVHWCDFGHSPAHHWSQVSKVWRIIYLDKQTLAKRFGQDYAYLAEIRNDSKEEEKDQRKRDEELKLAPIYEVWCRHTKKIYFFYRPKKLLISVKDIPLKLSGYFPCPKPLMATTMTNSLFPVADYVFYQDQADQLNKVTQKIDVQLDRIKTRGVYDAGKSELEQVLKAADGTMVALKDMPALMEKGGVQNFFQIIDIMPSIQALNVLLDMQDRIKSEIYEITGIADILRGQGNPSATAKAEGIKSKFATLRLSYRQETVQDFIKDIIVIASEIMVQSVGVDTLNKIVSVPNVIPDQHITEEMQHSGTLPLSQVMQALQDVSRVTYEVDIETDSTVRLDQDAEKADRIEFLTAVGQMLDRASAAAQGGSPELLKLIGELTLFGVRSFKGGRELEQSIQDTIHAAAQKVQQAGDPQQIQTQMKQMAEEKDRQHEIALQRIKDQAEAERAELNRAHEMQVEGLRAQVRLSDTGRSTYGQPT